MDIRFNPAYGDIEISEKDINVSFNTSEIALQRILVALKTNFKDYELSPYYGADIDKFIGQGIDKKLAEDIKKTIERTVLDENILDTRQINIPYIIRKNSIEFRIIIPNKESISLSYIKDKGFKIE